MISIYNLRKIKAFDRFDLIVSLLKMILSVPIAYRTRCRCLCLPFQSPEPTLHLILNLISISPTTSVCTSMPAHQPISPQVCLRHFCLFSAFFDVSETLPWSHKLWFPSPVAEPVYREEEVTVKERPERQPLGFLFLFYLTSNVARRPQLWSLQSH